MEEVEGIVVITGAAGGMGRPSAQRFGRQGRSLLLCDVNAQLLESLAEELRAGGATVDTLVGDVAAPGFPAEVIQALAGRNIFALIHTAGLSPTMADVDRILEVNFFASERLAAALLPHLSKGGCAVLISSTSGYMLGDPGMLAAIGELVGGKGREAVAAHATDPGVAYAISKRAVMGLVGREAAAFGERGVRIVSIAPGFIDTAMSRAEAEASEQMRAMIGMTPLGRMGQGDEIASVAEFLCSPGASYISGCDIKVDGGILGRLGL